MLKYRAFAWAVVATLLAVPVVRAQDAAKPQEAQRIAAYVPKWGAQLTASLSERAAWAVYRMLQKRYAGLIGDSEPIVLRGRIPGMGSAARYIIRIANDNRAPLDKLCSQLMGAGGACVVLRNGRAARVD